MTRAVSWVPVVGPWVLVVGWMGVIFYFSAQTGEASGGLSGALVDAVHNVFPTLDPGSLSVIVRKTAHVTEYAVLGALLAWALRGKRAWIAVMGGIAYAASDEVHQTFVPGRVGAVGDVLIDSVGVIIGVGCALWFSKRRAGSRRAGSQLERRA